MNDEPFQERNRHQCLRNPKGPKKAKQLINFAPFPHFQLEESTTSAVGTVGSQEENSERPSSVPRPSAPPQPENGRRGNYGGRRNPTNRVRISAKPKVSGAPGMGMQNKRPQLVNKLIKLPVIAGKSRR